MVYEMLHNSEHHGSHKNKTNMFMVELFSVFHRVLWCFTDVYKWS